ncbi:ACP S-malonyltransferase [Neptunicella sp.]|uniref:ACP S-malonyltransferase n=1 Tax=Neptunicella sp. TaxID=2125986 RepID=UPI003F692A9A
MQAFVFPGQGSQSVGMLADLASQYGEIKQCFAEASDVLGYDLWQRVEQGPAEELNATHITQPALLASSVAIWRVWNTLNGRKPEYLAGHSLGEYSALVCAGVINFADAIKLVEQRGQFMQQAVPAGVGGMFAIIGLDDAKVIECCEQAAEQQVVSAVNFNSPGQVVIAGHAEAVERAGALCKEAGAKRALPLPVSVPSHCALMIPAAEQLEKVLANIEFSSPHVPVINNVDVSQEVSPEKIKNALVRQLYSPVRWTETVQSLASMGVTEHFEMGPGKVLSGLGKRIDSSVQCNAVNTVETLEAVLKQGN